MQLQFNINSVSVSDFGAAVTQRDISFFSIIHCVGNYCILTTDQQK